MTLISRRGLLCSSLALAACKYSRQILEISGFSMGTTYNVVVVDHDNKFERSELKEAVELALADVNGKLSNWAAGSEISRFNMAPDQGATKMSSTLSRVMQTAEHVNMASQGRFDTTIGPLIELWGFGANGSFEKMPEPDAVARALEVSGHGNSLSMTGDSIVKRKETAQIYLSGIGKGYGADHIGEALAQMGVADFMVEIGGDLYAAGRNPDGAPWQIGIETPNPADRSVIDVVGLSGSGLATSGDYRNYHEIDGRRFSHLIDPTTGYPVTHTTASATVLADTAALADSWSTAMLILGREQGLEIASEHGVAVQFIERDVVGGKASFVTTKSQMFQALTA